MFGRKKRYTGGHQTSRTVVRQHSADGMAPMIGPGGRPAHGNATAKTVDYKNEVYPGQGVPTGVVGQPMNVYPGQVPNPHVLRGQEDMTNAPTTFNRIGTRWGDAQLKNGWWQTNWGRRMRYGGSGYLVTVAPTIPGQSRLSGGPLGGGYPKKGMAPSQWDAHVQSTAGQQPDTPAGPGQYLGYRLINPGSGG